MQRSASSGALPDPANVKVFMDGGAGPVDIQAGPGGYLYYVDLFGGTVRRIDYSSTKPVASFTATPASGVGPAPRRLRRRRLQRPGRHHAHLRVEVR